SMDDLGGAAAGNPIPRLWRPRATIACRQGDTPEGGLRLTPHVPSGLVLRAASAANGLVPSLPSDGGSNMAPALRGYGSTPRMRNSVAMVPRSIFPSTMASGLSSSATFSMSCESSSAASGGAAGANTRSTDSSTSFSIGSRVTTHVCPPFAETRPVTRRPSRPCGARSKLAARRGKARRPASFATAARVPSSATRSNRRPVSGTSLRATGTRQGVAARRSAMGFGFAIFIAATISYLTILDKYLSRVGKPQFALAECRSVLCHQATYRGTDIGRKPFGTSGHGLTATAVHVAPEGHRQPRQIGLCHDLL